MPKPLPEKLFLETFKYVPRLAVSLIIVNSKGQVLLARRAIPPEFGLWHMPGSFLLKGESIQQCIKRIAMHELRLKVSPTDAKLQNAFDNLKRDPRGHVVDLIYKLKTGKLPRTTSETKEVKFFDALPKEIGFNHGETLRKLGYSL